MTNEYQVPTESATDNPELVKVELNDSQIADLFRALIAEAQSQTSVTHPESTVRGLKLLLQALE